jgi:hypothetical protein
MTRTLLIAIALGGAVFTASANAMATTAPGENQAQGPAAATPAAATPVYPANPADVATLDAILKTLYEVISGPKEQKRDWNRFRSLFLKGARLIPTTPPASGPPGPRVLDVEDYVRRASGLMSSTGFFEKEVAQRVDQFGSIAQVFSTYESRHGADDAKPFARGINSIQFYFDGTRYWIVTIFWDAEGPKNPLPERYLKSPKKG